MRAHPTVDTPPIRAGLSARFRCACGRARRAGLRCQRYAQTGTARRFAARWGYDRERWRARWGYGRGASRRAGVTVASAGAHAGVTGAALRGALVARFVLQLLRTIGVSLDSLCARRC